MLIAGQAHSRAFNFILDYIGGTPPTNSIGGGSLSNCMFAAAQTWALAIRDQGTMLVHFGWDTNGGAYSYMNAQGGSPDRVIEGTIMFGTKPGSFTWYLDSTPLECEQATNYYVHADNIGGGLINDARYMTWPTTNTQFDAETTALHELGHLLGLVYGYSNYVAQSQNTNILITSGQFAGSVVPLQSGPNGVVAHIKFMLISWDAVPLMSSGTPNPGQRIFPSDLDIATDAQISGFSQINYGLNPILGITGPVPQRDIDPTSSSKKLVMALSWIQPLGGVYQVQQSSDLYSWQAASATIMDNGGNYSAIIPYAPTYSMFYRLKR